MCVESLVILSSTQASLSQERKFKAFHTHSKQTILSLGFGDGLVVGGCEWTPADKQEPQKLLTYFSLQ